MQKQAQASLVHKHALTAHQGTQHTIQTLQTYKSPHWPASLQTSTRCDSLICRISSTLLLLWTNQEPDGSQGRLERTQASRNMPERGEQHGVFLFGWPQCSLHLDLLWLSGTLLSIYLSELPDHEAAFSFSEITLQTLEKAIVRQSSQAMGVDEIPQRFVHAALPFLEPYLVKLFNLSLSQYVFSCSWKLSIRYLLLHTWVIFDLFRCLASSLKRLKEW